MTQKIRIIHIINSFEFGGAEAMLRNLLLRSDREKFEPSVVSLIDDMTVAQPLIDAGIPIAVMGMKPGIPDPRGVIKLARHLRRERPAVIQTWMDHSNLIGGIAARAVPQARVVWGVHHSSHIAGVVKRSTIFTVATCARLSRWLPTRIVCCSEHAAKLYVGRGFDSKKIQVIPNGFDTAHFCPNAAARRSVRDELGLAPDAKVVGLVARFDPLKDHRTFLEAAARFARTCPDVHFILCGADVVAENTELFADISRLHLVERCHLLGARQDMPRLYAAFDVAALSSISEAFPLTLGEAMACGVPCVSTGVGDVALILGQTGRMVPPSDPEALATAMSELITLPTAERSALGEQARSRICGLFDLGTITRRYESAYTDLVATAPGLFAEEDELAYTMS